jgi:glycosyltransferase involved in cell wall biosynthesis
MSVDLIIPTLNEIDGIKNIMPKIKNDWVDRILIVDGGSTDGTVEEAKRLGYEVISQKGKGHGAAFLTAINATNSDYILLWSPDGNHEPEEIPKLVKKIKEGYDQVLISRFGKTSINEDAGYFDTFGNKMFAFLVNCFFGGHWTDSLNESRIISRNAMMDIKEDIEKAKMSSTQQMSIRGLKRGQKICEIIGNERARIGGKRKMSPIPVGFGLSSQIIREFIFWSR